MYSLVIATLLTAGAETPDTHRLRPVRVYSACYGCYGGYAVPVRAYYRPPVVYSSCFGCCGGMVYSSCFGCYGGQVITERVVVEYQQPPVQMKVQTPKAQSPSPAKDQAPKDQAPKGQAPGKGKTASMDAPARVMVKAPMDVKIYVNGQLIRRQKDEQVLQTPELSAGKLSTMRLWRAAGDDASVVIERKISVEAGRESILDLSREVFEPCQSLKQYLLE